MVLVAYLIGTVASAQVPFTKAATKEVMKRVADWQIANPNNGAEHDDLDWTHAALYMGMIDWAEIAEQEDGNDTYYKWLLKIGRKNHFQIIAGNTQGIEFKLYDTTGSIRAQGNTTTIDTNSLSQGIYILHVTDKAAGQRATVSL